MKKMQRCSEFAETQMHAPLNINITHTVVIGSRPLKMSVNITDLYSFFHLL